MLLLKFLPLTYHHSHFLAATLDFTSFFTIAFLRAAHFFYSWLFWIRYLLHVHYSLLDNLFAADLSTKGLEMQLNSLQGDLLVAELYTGFSLEGELFLADLLTV